MTGFLDTVAKKLTEKFGKNISEYTLVLPGQRACWLLKEKLIDCIVEPCWEPEFTTLSILTSQTSGLQQAIDIVLLAKLFNICKNSLGSDFFSDDFDSFVSWGEILLNDFSGIDNNMVDAQKLFTYISDIETIDQRFNDGSIEAEAENALKRHTQPKDSKYYGEFLKIWSRLYDIYTRYREELLSQNIGYSGMINRKAAENAKRSDKKYIFIGFNTFNESEYLFIKRIEPVAVYWDGCNFFDDEETNNTLNPDGMAAFKRKIGCPIEEIICLEEKTFKREIEVVRCSTDVMQCKAVMKRLETIPNVGYETAVVLADDSLLPIMLQSIPKKISDVNITTGLPITDSSVYVFYRVLESIITNQKKELYKRDDIQYFLKNNLFAEIWEDDRNIEEYRNRMEKNMSPYLKVDSIDNPLFKRFFCNTDNPDFSIGDYLMDSLSFFAEKSASDDITEISMRIIKAIRSLDISIKRYGIDLSSKLYLRMLDRILSRKYTPYVTEAMTGLQVTGILETRCQDFKNVFILSTNDDTLPKGSQLLSFIPMNLREHFHLPQSGDFQRMSASYFYHLLFRAEKICLLYNGNTSSNRTGEISRFIHQIEYLTPKNTIISYTTIVSKLQTNKTNAIVFNHSSSTQEKLQKSKFSATMLCQYLKCQRQFALKYYYNLEPAITSSEDFKNNDYGTAVHNTLEVICKKGYNKKTAKQYLDNFETEIVPILEKYGYKFMEEKYPHKVGTTEMTRLKRMIEKWIKNVLEYDSLHEDFSTEATEKVFYPIICSSPEIKTKMIVDRIDKIGDKFRIIDYKSGSKKNLNLSDIDKVFEPFKNRKDRDPLLQTLLYGINFEDGKWTPAIYSLPKLGSEDYSPYIEGNMQSPDLGGFKEGLENLIKEILDPNPNKIFDPCPSKGSDSYCKYCDYKSLCKLFPENNTDDC